MVALRAVRVEDHFDRVLEGLGTAGQLVHVERLPARPPVTAEPARPIDPKLLDLLGAPGLWSHQAAAIDLIRDRQHVAIATGTASGKSLCYQIPIAEAVANQPGMATALALFPTKALAQDQLRALATARLPGISAATYDGDTPTEQRGWIRRNANVVFTNPEMLHVGILPAHHRWDAFLRRLQIVVIDEMHLLRGVFGTHAADVIRRLRRLCAARGANPTFVFTSATIGEPGRLASELCGLPVATVDNDGSPVGERRFVIWNPPIIDERTGVRGSTHVETSALMADLVEGGHRTIAFTQSRRATEMVAADVRGRSDALASTVEPYRAGFLPGERRTIEQRLFSGELLGVVSTSALELGVDVGGLDACLLDGFPGTIASMWQRAGRAGRRGQEALAVLIPGADQLDQWFVHHPRELFDRSPEPSIVNPSNPHILEPHIACAAHEAPLSPDDSEFWPEGAVEEAVRRLVIADHLLIRNGRAVWTGHSPAHDIGLRSGSADEVVIATENGQPIGTVDASRATSTVHEGAIYLHHGRRWKVTHLDLESHEAIVTPGDDDHDTRTMSDTDVSILETSDSRSIGAVELCVGAVEVLEQVTGYQLRDRRTRKVLETAELDLPPSRLVTRAFWYRIPESVLDQAGLLAKQWPGTLHAVEHAGIGILPLFAICDRWDVGGVSTAWLPDTGDPTIVIYDGHPGGAGVAELGFAAGIELLAATHEVIDQCACTHGCPSCVQSPKCGNLNEPLDKAGALALLQVMLPPEARNRSVA